MNKARLKKLEELAAVRRDAEPRVKIIEIVKDYGDHIEVETIDATAPGWRIVKVESRPASSERV